MLRAMINPNFWLTSPSADGDTLKSIMEETGVDYCVNLPVATHTKGLSIDQRVKSKNDYALELNQTTGLISLAALHPEQDKVEDHIKSLRDQGFTGVKLHPYFQKFDPSADKLKNVYQALARNGLFVLIDNFGWRNIPAEYQTTPQIQARILMDFPDLVVISPHLGGLPWYGKEAVFQYLVEPKYKNLYLDTSNAYIRARTKDWEAIEYIFNLQIQIDDKQCGTDIHKEKMDLFCRRFIIPDSVMLEIIHKIGPEKIVFGTDWPAFFHDREVNRIKRLGLKPEEEDLIFYQNAARLLKLT
ncbi:MAG: amidohydrolase family protein [bacterium]|nr:amidohydrolase family protein [bacterium]